MKNKVLKISAASLGTLHCINKYIDSNSANNTMKASGKYYHWKHGEIFYRVAGEGSPLLLIHDLNVFSSENDWNQIMNRLTSKYRVYVPDLIGCGRSEKPSVTYTGYLYVQLISDFIKDVIGEEANAAAEGLSAAYVMMADSLDKNLFKKIMLINPPALSSARKLPDQRSKALIRLFGLPIIGKTCYYIAVNKSNTENYLSETCFYNPFGLKQQTVKAAYQAAHFRNGGGRFLFASLQANYLNVNPAEAIKKAEKEISLVLGEQLPAMEDIAEKYTELNDTIKVNIIKNARMLPEVEAPDEIADFLCEMDS